MQLHRIAARGLGVKVEIEFGAFQPKNLVSGDYKRLTLID